MEALHQSNCGWPWLTFVTLTHIWRIISRRQYLWDRKAIAATATMSCIVVQLGMPLGGRWHMRLWPSPSRVKTPCTTFLFFGSSIPTYWPRTFLFGRMGNVKKPHVRSKIIHISKAVTTIAKPRSELVHFEVLLAYSPINVTLTLWKSVKVAWPNFHLSLLECIGIYVWRSN